MAKGDTVSKEECIKLLQHFHKETGSTSSREYKKWGRYMSPCYTTIYRKFGCWSDAIHAAGIASE